MAKIEVIIEGSGKHCHLSRETLDALFGKGFEMEVKKMLSQPGQFATPHKITVVGPKGQTTMSILGPCRKADQIELSFTDARALGLNCPIRESGDLAGSPGCKLIGPCGEVDIAEGCIIAKRHVHLTPEDAEKFGITDKQIVKLQMLTARPVIFDDVLVRVSDQFASYAHLDFDEANACLWKPGALGRILV